MSNARNEVTLEEVRRQGREDAIMACRDSGNADTPDGGWDSWLVEGVGLRELCRLFGEREEEQRDGWSCSMHKKLTAYHRGALEGAAEWREQNTQEPWR